MIDLTEQQRQAVRDGEAVRLAAPEIGEDVVLLRAAQYETMRNRWMIDANSRRFCGTQ